MTEAKTLTKEEFVKLFKKNYDRRRFALDIVKEFAYRLTDEEAFIFSRLAPKEILEELFKGKRGNIFVDKVLDYHNTLDKDAAKQTIQIENLEDRFIEKRVSDLVAVVGGA